MKVIFRNPIPAVETTLRYYNCINCNIEFRWSEDCLSRVIIEDKYHDKTECLCENCSNLFLKNQLKI